MSLVWLRSGDNLDISRVVLGASFSSPPSSVNAPTLVGDSNFFGDCSLLLRSVFAACVLSSTVWPMLDQFNCWLTLPPALIGFFIIYEATEFIPLGGKVL